MKEKKGFTIVELMLAMAFLGTMMMGIASLIIKITNIYQKGLAIRNVNTVGREILSDLSRTVTAAPVGSITVNPDPADHKTVDMSSILAARSKYFVEQRSGGKQMSGAFCTGDYSYVWNTADSLRAARTHFNSGSTPSLVKGRINTSEAAITNYLSHDAGQNTIIVKIGNGKYLIPKFIRFLDTNRDVCISKSASDNGKTYYTMDRRDNTVKRNDSRTLIDLTYSGVKENNITELIAENEADLALYDFMVVPATQNYSTYQIFYSGSFILATYRGGVNIQANGDFCQGADNPDLGADSEYTGNDFDYCAVNKFNFAVRATGDTGVDVHGGN